MKRREFLATLGGLGLVSALAPLPAWASGARYDRLLVLVELKGGNDGLNTVVPYADPAYAALRPRLGLRRDEVLQLSERAGLHPALEALLPLWRQGELAIVQGLGYPGPNLSHFRSIEIWDTASKSDEYLQQGWLARAFAAAPVPSAYAADAVVLGSHDMGPLTGARAIALSRPEQFLRQARLAGDRGQARNAAMAHVLGVESHIALAADRLSGGTTPALRSEFPKGAFGDQVKGASQLLAAGTGVAVLRLSLSGFDTHRNQPDTHARLLKELAEGLAALRAALDELKLWQRSLILTYAEFGRRPKENQSKGTDHGTAAAHFVLGGAVRGGLYGAAPDLARLDGNGNLAHTVDFRSLYATALERWWGLDARAVLGGRFAPLELLRT